MMRTMIETNQMKLFNGAVNKKSFCVKCKLWENCKSPKIKPVGDFKKGIINIGSSPSLREDETKKIWYGPGGHLLREQYKKIGIDLFEDCLNMFAVSCRTKDEEDNDRVPSLKEIEYCYNTVVYNTIKKYKPHLVVLFGDVALKSVIGMRWKKELGSINKWRGFMIPDRDFQCWIYSVYHPDDLIDDDVLTMLFKKDLEKLSYLIENQMPAYKTPEIEVIKDLSVLCKIKDVCAIDYETTGIKPYGEGHKIVCVSVADSENHAFVFLTPKTRRELKPFLDLLGNPSILKVGHNIKYEDMWSKVYFDQSVEGWYWDTMLMSHVLDNRDGITSLKFQTYINFGIIDYASEIEPYLKADDSKNGNAFNSVMQLLSNENWKDKLLKYCGFDAVYTYRLWKIQSTLMKDIH